jgi:hypothetical protein
LAESKEKKMPNTSMKATRRASRGLAKPLITVNAAFMHEIKEASGELWQILGELTNLCSHPLSTRLHPQRAVELLQQLQDQLGLYFTLEEYYGYFESPAFVDPRFSERASALRAQHQSMYLDICAIVDRAERLLDQRRFASLTHHIAVRVDSFYEQLKAHEAAEQNLLQSANGETQ